MQKDMEDEMETRGVMFRALGGVWTCFLRVVNRQRIVKQEVAIGSRAWSAEKESKISKYGPLLWALTPFR